tara:strand:+ start:821 stop:946 length:126 start_codon:yes stop_codon:yes gene_type:complete
MGWLIEAIGATLLLGAIIAMCLMVLLDTGKSRQEKSKSNQD